LCLGGVQPWAAFGGLWLVWWVGDAIGALVVAPVLLVWARIRHSRIEARRVIEAGALLLALTTVSLSVFAGSLGLRASRHPLHCAIFPFVGWAGLRFGQRGATAATLCASSVAIWSTLHGWGPFSVGTIGESLVLLQFFMAVVALTGLLLGAAITERDQAERRRAADYRRLEEGEKRLRLAVEAGRMRVWEWDIQTGQVRWSTNPANSRGVPGPE